MRQFIPRSVGRCTREDHVFSKCSRSWASQSSPHLAGRKLLQVWRSWVRFPSWTTVKYCLTKSKTHFIGSLEIELLYSEGAYCFLPGSPTSHHVGHWRYEGTKEVRSHGPATKQISMRTSLSQLDVLSTYSLEHFSSDKSGIFCQRNAKSRKTSAMSAVFSNPCLFTLKVCLWHTVAFQLELTEIFEKAA